LGRRVRIDEPGLRYSASGGLIEWKFPEPADLFVDEIYTVGVSPGFGHITRCGYKVDLNADTGFLPRRYS
jgi:hypothetical protein